MNAHELRARAIRRQAAARPRGPTRPCSWSSATAAALGAIAVAGAVPRPHRWALAVGGAPAADRRRPRATAPAARTAPTPTVDLAEAIADDCIDRRPTRSRSATAAPTSRACSWGSSTPGTSTARSTGQFDQATYARGAHAAGGAQAVRRRRRRPGDGAVRRRLARRAVVRRPHPAAGTGRRGLEGLPAVVGRLDGRRRPAAAARLRLRPPRRVRARGPAGVGRRRRRPDHPLVARVGQQVRQRAARLPRGVQPVGAVQRLELPGDTCR